MRDYKFLIHVVVVTEPFTYGRVCVFSSYAKAKFYRDELLKDERLKVEIFTHKVY